MRWSLFALVKGQELVLDDLKKVTAEINKLDKKLSEHQLDVQLIQRLLETLEFNLKR